jgi:hypothetical protein
MPARTCFGCMDHPLTASADQLAHGKRHSGNATGPVQSLIGGAILLRRAYVRPEKILKK